MLVDLCGWHLLHRIGASDSDSLFLIPLLLAKHCKLAIYQQIFGKHLPSQPSLPQSNMTLMWSRHQKTNHSSMSDL